MSGFGLDLRGFNGCGKESVLRITMGDGQGLIKEDDRVEEGLPWGG